MTGSNKILALILSAVALSNGVHAEEQAAQTFGMFGGGLPGMGGGFPGMGGMGGGLSGLTKMIPV
ncbi:hypothetical protein DVH05_011472 [Phytophthora capsici]|nr:hypothetical protein DVH05_011472 [Phytophthora capsici]